MKIKMIKRLVFIGAMALSLQACLPVIFVAGAGAGGAIVADKRPVNTMLKDRDIANVALERIQHDSELRMKARITVAVFNYNLLLIGQAPTAELRDHAYKLVSSVPGIKRIYNEITIEAPISAMQQTNDSWMTTKVKTMMVAEKGLNSGQIKVVTENAVVYLMGIVTHKQADIATDIARQVSGVRKVVKLFEYEQ
jgi:osmotically-inducible protein OsmY